MKGLMRIGGRKRAAGGSSADLDAPRSLAAAAMLCAALLALIGAGLLAMLAGPAAAGGDEGTSGGITLTFPSGARALSMAEAYTVSVGDINGVYYNPAVISALGAMEVSVFYGRGFFDDDYGGITCVRPAGPGALGASLKYYTTGGIALDNGENVRTVTGMSDYLLGLSYGARVWDAVGIGGTLKVLRSTLVEDFAATSVAADIGLTYRVGESGFLFGASLANLGSDLKYRDSGVPLAWAAGLGALYHGVFLKAPASAAADIVQAREGSLRSRIGLEIRPGGHLAVRVGYKFGYDSDSFTVGLGVRAGKFDVNYAAGMGADLDNLHLLQITYKF